MKKSLIVATLISLSIPAFADINEKDVQEYVRLYGVSVQEASQALNIEANKEQLIDEIEAQYNGRIAGIYTERTPTYKIVVRLKGNGSNEKKELAVKNVAGSVPVEFQYGAKETKEVATGQIQKAQKLAQNYFSTVQLVGYNERTGSIDIEINEKSSPDVLNKINELKSSWKNPKIDLNVILVDYKIKPMALAHGGTPVIDKSQVSTTGRVETCTTAFGVQDSSGKKYMSTAAHCPNNFEEKATGIKYSFVKEIPWAQGNDLQWNSTSSTISNQFRDGPTSTRTLTGRRLLKSTKVGDIVCHYGAITGYSCGEVSVVGTSIGAIAPNLASSYPGQFWVRVNTPTCKQGDSGGPAFTASTIASGIVSLAIEEDHDDNDPTNDTCLGYLYLPTDKIYENGLSFVYK